MLLIGASSLALHQQPSAVGKAKRSAEGERSAGRKSSGQEGKVSSLAPCAWSAEHWLRDGVLLPPLDPSPRIILSLSLSVS